MKPPMKSAKDNLKPALAFTYTFCTYLSVHAVRKAFTVAKPSLTKAYGWDSSFLGQLDTCFMICYGLGQFLFGRLGDVFPAKSVLLFGAIMAALSVTLTGFWPQITTSWLFIPYVLWCLNGLGQSCCYPTSVKLLGEWFDKSVSGQLFGIWCLCIAGGNVVGGILTGWITEEGLGIAAMFWLPSLMLTFFAVILFLFFPKNDYTPIIGDKKQEQMSAWEVLQIPGVIRFSIANIFVKTVTYFNFFWLPYYFHFSQGFTRDEAAFISVLFDIGQMAGPIVLGLASDHSGKTNTAIVISMFLSAIPIIMLKFFPISTSLICFNTFLAGLLVGGPAELITTMVAADIGETSRGNVVSSVSGYINGFGALGTALYQWLVGIMITYSFGWQLSFALTAVLSILSCFCLWSLVTKEWRPAVHPSPAALVRVNSSQIFKSQPSPLIPPLD